MNTLSPVATGKDDLTARLIATFKQLISEGSLVPGCRLPAERELAENFGVSRSSLRQALKVLEIMGIISQRVGDGTYLNAAASSMLGEPLEFLILLNGISFQELIEARIIVEPELAARAAERATTEDLRILKESLEAMKESRPDRARLVEQDLLFHETIFRASGNRVCSLMFTLIHKSIHSMIELTSKLVDLEHTLALHRAVYVAIQRRDSEEARRRMAEHLLDVRGLLQRANDEHHRSRIQSRITTLSAARHRVGLPARKTKAS
jgi:GntR family transcriptional repressor for pyruvate dehydrogenase complex